MSIRTSCVNHSGYIGPLGYGRQSHKNRTVQSHRLAYCRAHGLELSEIDGEHVRHKCDNRACVNPEHLELGTHVDNMRDMDARGRRVVTRGSALPQAKLTEADVHSVRMLLWLGLPQRRIAALVGVTQPRVSEIKHQKAWNHVN